MWQALGGGGGGTIICLRCAKESTKQQALKEMAARTTQQLQATHEQKLAQALRDAGTQAQAQANAALEEQKQHLQVRSRSTGKHAPLNCQERLAQLTRTPCATVPQRAAAAQLEQTLSQKLSEAAAQAQATAAQALKEQADALGAASQAKQASVRSGAISQSRQQRA